MAAATIPVTVEAVTRESNARAILDAAEKFGATQLVSLPGLEPSPPVLVVPKGRELKSIKAFVDEYADRPDRKKGTATLTSVDSFIAHVNRHKDGASAVFADDNRERPALLAVLDYNEPGADGLPRFGQHRANYAFPLSDEWLAWMGATKSTLTQAQLAEFLEDHIRDVLPPSEAGASGDDFAAELAITLASPQALITLSRGLNVKVDRRVKTVQSLSSGECSIVFEEAHQGEDGGSLKVPGGFVVGIPVFRNGPAYRVPFRLRYRLNQGVTWQLVPHRADLVFQHAFDEVVEKVKAGTELPLFFGRPEAA